MPSLAGLTLLQASREPARYRALLRLEPDSPLLAGHFPGHPILPGIAHLGLALRGARELEGQALSLASLRGVRFRRPVAPGDTIELSVARSAGPRSLRFELRRAADLLSSGVFVVGEDVRD